MTIQNYTEVLVREVMTEYLKLHGFNGDETEREDVLAIVLNKLPQRYFLSTSNEGEKKAFLLDKQLRMKALIEISAAATDMGK
ncbi:late competence development ComFB family protein [Anaerosolibacter sp.]|uniref:late competence development ComFB family protein n=1 Tax=Anaerosolibacter sp. TaxID=1872527 RepID=UPI0039EF71F9